MNKRRESWEGRAGGTQGPGGKKVCIADSSSRPHLLLVLLEPTQPRLLTASGTAGDKPDSHLQLQRVTRRQRDKSGQTPQYVRNTSKKWMALVFCTLFWWLIKSTARQCGHWFLYVGRRGWSPERNISLSDHYNNSKYFRKYFIIFAF